jgi:hypothetical protein
MRMISLISSRIATLLVICSSQNADACARFEFLSKLRQIVHHILIFLNTEAQYSSIQRSVPAVTLSEFENGGPRPFPSCCDAKFNMN